MTKRVRDLRKTLTTLQERAESKAVGQVLIGGLVAVFVIVTLVWSMPDSTIQRGLVPVVRPIAIAGGLDQNWGVFSPNPPQQLEEVEVQVTMADGAIKVWTLPRGNVVVGHYSWYRWPKLKEYLVRIPEIRADFSHWVVREIASDGQPTRVQMILRTEQLVPPGDDVTPAIDRSVLYDEQLTR